LIKYYLINYLASRTRAYMAAANGAAADVPV
jgi:hypothetical protein